MTLITTCVFHDLNIFFQCHSFDLMFYGTRVFKARYHKTLKFDVIRNFRVEYANAWWDRSWNFDIDKLGKLQIRWNYDAYTYTVIKSINLSLYCCQFCTKYMFINRTIKPFFYAISVSENRLTSCKPFNRFKMAQLCMWKEKNKPQNFLARTWMMR